MDTALLLKWLGLPPGPWPPDDRALLGLPPAPAAVSAADAEQQALGRMETLRPHQLRHPELVTEGMNRLAQALIGVMAAAPAAAAAPPPAAKKPARPARPKSQPKLESLPPPDVDFAPRPAAPPPPPPAAVVLDAEVILDAEAVLTPPRPAAPRPVLPASPVAVPEPPEGTNYFPSDRRKSYRELVFLRRLRLTWGLLRSTLGDPNEPLTSAEAVYELLSGARDLARLRPRDEFGRVIRGDAESVAAVAVQPAVLSLLRELVPSQRWGLAVSWDAGRVAIDRREKWLRERMRDTKPLRRRGAGDGELGEFLRANPEWVLVLVTAAAITLGVLRAIGRSAG